MSMISCTQARLLVVADSDVDRLLLYETLRSLGFDDIAMASNARDAILLLQDEEFHAVFTDVEMPEINGSALLATIRTDLMLWHVPVFLVSSCNTPEIVANAERFEASGFISKPVTRTALEEAIQRAGLH